jgi:hypothetical protein
MRESYNQMNHLSDWDFREIIRQLLRGIEFIGVRDIRVRVNRPKCFDDLLRRKGILEL